MRMIIYFIMLISINICDLYSSDPCTDPNCINMVFPYIFCREGENSKTTICTKDPNNLPGYQPIKEAGLIMLIK
jgi:hypothetical protein